MIPPINPLATALEVFERGGAAQRAIGLIHLLAVAYNAKDDRNGPPTQEEADGVIRLATQTGEDLKAALDNVSKAADATVQTSPETAA